jgi:rhodanese-related sulfurtransferase
LLPWSVLLGRYGGTTGTTLGQSILFQRQLVNQCKQKLTYLNTFVTIEVTTSTTAFSAAQIMPTTLFPIPQSLKAESTVFALKERLDWGEPALTIIDVRNREDFNASRITGAISIPATELVVRATASLETDRDIYVYGETDEQTTEAATQLRNAGFENVAELKGGLAAWKAAKAPVEGF